MMKRTPKYIGTLAVLALSFAAAGPVAAQDINQLMGAGEDPVSIDAEEGIEWRRDEQMYIARGNAKVTRGKLSVAANVLRAHYRKGKKEDNEVWKVDAIGKVVIASEKETVYGDKGVYNMDTNIFVLTGKKLLIEADGQTVTARDKLEYNHNDRVARAFGNATATQEDKVLRADVLTARFTQVEGEKLALKEVEASGNVVVTTNTERASSNKARYDAITETMTLNGNVKLTRGTSQLNGEYAEVNLKTGVSKVLARPRGASGGGPVQGLFVPGSKDEGKLDIPMPGLESQGKKKQPSKD